MRVPILWQVTPIEVGSMRKLGTRILCWILAALMLAGIVVAIVAFALGM